MAAPILLVHDDLQVIAALRRMLAREGYEVVLATSAADAVIAFGHHLPALMLLSPTVESGRGHVVLDELKNHPDAKLLKVLLLGESIPGYGHPIAPMPPDDTLAAQINELAGSPGDEWTMTEPQKTIVRPTDEAPADDFPPPQATAPTATEATAGWRTQPAPSRDLEGALFGDLEQQMQNQIEAEATASVQSQLASMHQPDPELDELESEVRAEAQRRRKQREASAPRPPPVLSAAAEQSAQFELKEPSPPAASGPAQPSLDELESRKAAAAARQTELEAKVKAAETAAETARGQWAAREAAAHDAVEAAEKALKAARAQSDTERRSQRGEVEQLKRAAEHGDTLVRQERELRARAEERIAELEAELKALKEQAFDTQSRLKELDAALVKAQGAHEETRDELSLVAEEHTAVTAKLEEEMKRSRERSEAAAELEMKVLELEEARDNGAQVAKATTEQLMNELQHERGERATAEQHQRELLGDIEKTQGELEDARAQLETEREAASLALKSAHDETAALRAQLDEIAAQKAAEQARALVAETAAKKAEAHVKELEDRAILPLAPAGKPALGVPRTGTVKLGELARLVATLTLGGAEVRVELGVAGGTRNLWLKRGQLVAAESSLPYETLSDRARRDGLIDARQEADLSSVRGASATELLAVMKQRGLVRELEVPGLVQRYTEAVALDAFTESSCTYRLHDEQPGVEVLAGAATRGVLPMVAEALRRVLPVETQLEALGGSEAIPHPTDTDLDARVLGFTERERRMLGYVDGEATLEDVVLAAGLRPDHAYKVLSVAKYLGLIEVQPPAQKRPEPSPLLDVQRLEAKFEQVQEADYFSILGLPRNAGTDEVQRAFERLSDEFDPIRFSGHQDPALQQRAAVVHRLLEEAARALEDDRRRAEYARHLLD